MTLERRLSIVAFDRGRTVSHGSTTWQRIMDGETLDGKDLRVLLFDGKFNDPYMHTLLFDLDKIGREHEDVIVDVFDRMFAWKQLIFFTGRGWHVCLPLATRYASEERPLLFESYTELCDKVASELRPLLPMVPFEVDVKPFRGSASTRMPGSVNGKNGVRVEHVETLEGELLDDISSVLEHRQVERPEKDKRQSVADHVLSDSLVHKHCAWIRHVKDNVNTISYDLWMRAMCLCANAGRRDWADDINADYEKDCTQEVDEFFRRPGRYSVKCRTIKALAWEKDKLDVCAGCPHDLAGNNPLNITGRMPTPTHSDGYHLRQDDVVNDRRACAEDVAAAWYNGRPNAVLWGSELWDYESESGLYVRLSQHAHVWRNYSEQLKRELCAVPTYGLYSEKDRKRVAECLAAAAVKQVEDSDFDSPDHMAVANGVLDTKTGTLLEPAPHPMMRTKIPVAWNEDADTSLIENLYRDVLLCEDALELLQSFLGMTLGNVPCEEYQQFAWLCGPSDSGKSTVLQIVRRITGDAVIPYGASSNFQERDDKSGLDYGHKKAVIIDDLKLSGSQTEQFVRWVNPLASGQPVKVKIPWAPEKVVFPKTTLLVTSNRFPPLEAKLEGFHRRVRTINFSTALTPRAMEQVGVICSTTAGREAALKWAVEGLRKCLERKRLTGKHLPGPTPFERHLATQMSPVSDVDRWASERLEVREGAVLHPSEAATDYKQWTSLGRKATVDAVGVIRAAGQWASKTMRKPYEKIVCHDGGRAKILGVSTIRGTDGTAGSEVRGAQGRKNAEGAGGGASRPGRPVPRRPAGMGGVQA